MRTDVVVDRILSFVPLSCNWWEIVRMNNRLPVGYDAARLDNITQCTKHHDKAGREEKYYEGQHFVGVIHFHCELHEKRPGKRCNVLTYYFFGAKTAPMIDPSSMHSHWAIAQCHPLDIDMQMKLISAAARLFLLRSYRYF